MELILGHPSVDERAERTKVSISRFYCASGPSFPLVSF